MEWLTLLWGTVLLRPYVFLFLAVYLIIAILNMGVIRSVVFTVLAYTIAFSSEYSSTRNGFPYGFYSYIETTRNQELWISNVPFMDSLSYSFLYPTFVRKAAWAFSSFETSRCSRLYCFSHYHICWHVDGSLSCFSSFPSIPCRRDEY